jgi:hypothetical protein
MTPENESDQTAALDAALQESGRTASVQRTAATPEQAAEGARELLKIMAGLPEMRTEVESRVAEPPWQEALAVPLVLAAPVVLTGCIVVLQVAAHVHFVVGSDGRWSLKYDPSKRAPLDNILLKIVDRLSGVMGWLPGSRHAR